MTVSRTVASLVVLLGLLVATSVPARAQVEATVPPFVAAMFTDDSGIGGSLDTVEVMGLRAGVVIRERVRIEGEVALGETIRRSTVVFGNRAPTLGSRLVGASQIRDEIDLQAVGVNATWLLPVGPVELGPGAGVGRMWLLPDMADRDNYADSYFDLGGTLRTPGSSVAVRLDLRDRIHLCHAEGLTPCGVDDTLHHILITGGMEFRW